LSRLTFAFGAALLAVAIAVTSAVVATTAREENWLFFALILTVAVAFVVSGLVALSRRPENRTGVYLAAVGYLAFFSILSISENEWIFTVAFVVEGLIWAPFAALIFAFPTGQLHGRLERTIPVLTGVMLVGASLLIVLLDKTPGPERCGECPESPIVVAEYPGIARAVEAATTVCALAVIALSLGLLVRRWRAASPALRRLLWPVLAAGSATLFAIGLVVIADEFSDSVAEAGSLLLVLSFACVPIAFLVGILRTTFARASVTDLLLGLQAGTPLREALAVALRDPSVEIAYRLDPRRGVGGEGWVDAEGRRVAEPVASSERAVKHVDLGGVGAAAVAYDVSLTEEPELVEAVTTAAGLALQNERLQAELRAEIRLAGALAETVPSLLTNVDTEGRIIRFNEATLRASGYSDEDEVRGRYFWDVFIAPEEREAMIGRFAAAAPDFAPSEYENTFTNARGERFVVYWRSAPVLDEEGRVVSIVAGGLDITERKQREEEAALRSDFLDAITDAIPSFLVAVDHEGVVMEDGVNPAFTQAFGWTKEELGGRSFLEVISDEDQYEGHMAIANAANGVIQAERESWWVGRDGAARAVAWTARPVLDPQGRDIVLVSGSDVTVRRRQEEELRASRARLVEAADDARRKLERNLHDGAQQRLVALSVSLRLAESKLHNDPPTATRILGDAREELTHALEDLRELARGIHPAVLTDRGLRAAVDALVSRSPVPVEASVPQLELPPAVEAAAYYVVAEALTNVVKYGHASLAEVSVETVDGSVRITVKDDGVGGADPTRGSGLRGLSDRVEALEGRLVVESAAGSGTTVRAEIPLTAHAKESRS
jgi:PAS domain S-box-containing protein